MAQRIQVLPEDVYNRTLVTQVHPPDWVNPEPIQHYNLVVIGARIAGLLRHEAVSEMRAGPSESTRRRRLQTTSSCCT